jgi:hypothetical protein
MLHYSLADRSRGSICAGEAEVEFIAENGGGPGVRLKKARRAATKPKKGD